MSVWERKKERKKERKEEGRKEGREGGREGRKKDAASHSEAQVTLYVHKTYCPP